MLSSTPSILRMAIKCSWRRLNASRFGSDCLQWPWRLSNRRLIGSALFGVLPAGPMHRALQRLDQFVSFNFIAAPVAFQKSVEHTSGPQLPGFEGDVISILHLYFTFLKDDKGPSEHVASMQPSGRIFSHFKRLVLLEAVNTTTFFNVATI